MSVSLTTERLTLTRPLRAADISSFLPLIGDFAVVKNLSRVPHPYTEDDACAFVVWAAKGWRTGEDCTFAITARAGGAYLGTCGVHPGRGYEFGYWLGKPFWGRGYATEAGRRLVAFGFDGLKAECLIAKWFHDNPASGRVLVKLGLTASGDEYCPCLARGGDVLAHRMALDRAAYRTRKNAP